MSSKIEVEGSRVPGERLVALLWLAIFVVAGALLLIYLASAYSFLLYPFQIDYGEGFVLYFADVLSQGQSLYKDISQRPYVSGLYPPLFPLICAGLMKIFGLSFAVGRALSFVAALLIALLIFAAVARPSQKQVATTSAILFLSSPFVFQWSLLYRVDTLGLLFSFLGVLIVHRHWQSRFLLLCVPCFLLALATKQSFVAAPLAAVAYLSLTNRKRALHVGALLVAGGSGLFFLANHLTNGQLYEHVVAHHLSLPLSLKAALGWYRTFLRAHMILVAFAGAAALYSLSRRRYSIFHLYFFAAALSLITAGKAGADINYFMELVAVSCVLFGLLFGELVLKFRKETSLQVAMISVLAVQLTGDLRLPAMPSQSAIDDVERVSAYIVNSDGKILTDEAGLAVLNGVVPAIEPFMLTQLARRGMWDQSALLDDLREKSFSLVILRADLECGAHGAADLLLTDELIQELCGTQGVAGYLLTDEMIQELTNSYDLVEVVGDFHIYRPSDARLSVE